jgi:uncharacterized protein YbjT (DUF2867 family)
MSDCLVLIAGATGRQGGAAARALLAAGIPIRILVRNAASDAAVSLAKQGADVVLGDFQDSSSLRNAVTGAAGVFSVQPLLLGHADREVAWGRALADAAEGAGVRHFVYSSVDGAEHPGGVPHFESKHVLEAHLRTSKMSVTILRPAGFMETLLIPQVRKGIGKGNLTTPYALDTPQRLVAVDDIGAAAAAVFRQPGQYAGRVLTLTGDVLSTREQAAILSRVLQRPMQPRKLPGLITRLALGRDLQRMFRWIESQPVPADDRATLRAVLPRAPLDFATWASAQGF